MTNFLRYTAALTFGLSLLWATTLPAQDLPAPLPKLPDNWHALDLKTDGYFGISLNQAYAFLKGKKSKPVIVAVIDSGVDTLQKDLISVLWTNLKEIAGNGKDDDKNGYIDDIHGWNFLGGLNGKAAINETTEEIREYARLKPMYQHMTAETAENKQQYAYWLSVKATRDATIAKSTSELDQYMPFLNALIVTNGFLKKALNLKADATFNKSDLEKLETGNDTLVQSKELWSMIFMQGGDDKITAASVLKEFNDQVTKLNNDINPDLEIRKRIVGDDPNDNNDKSYGNNLLKFSDGSHGTGVAGLIAAVRNNGYGVNGVADNVRIMAIKAVPNGDEYDKDVANAIRYAVDNGAKIINMSFGKKLSPHKDWVDEAFKYAAEKDVLLVQAAGNDNQDMDLKPQYPNDSLADSSATDMDNVISVGASSAKPDEQLVASFSNYGKKNVDVFAPGVKVTSLDLEAEQHVADGTSFASPITAGVAALVLSYYPKLSAKQLKQVIMKSAKPLNGTMVIKPGTTDRVDFTTLSKTGGIINAYEAVVIASKMKGER
ncbi:MAG: S8 family serine peptidase [Sphingobacteriaceae bacterium]